MLRGRTALVTGASKRGGIGAAIARAYAEQGANLILVARSKEGLDEERILTTAQACQALASDITVDTLTCDLSEPSEIDALHADVASKGRAVDILVANAGASLGGADPLKGDPDGWDAMVALNVVAPMRLTRLWAPEMAARGFGALIFTGSLAGVLPTKNAAYCASKHAVRSWALSCYEALRDQGITVSVLEPGFVDTPLVKDVPGDHSMFIQPEDVAQAALLPLALRSAAPVEIVLRLVRRAQ